MSDTPRTDAMASEVEHLGSGGRALYQGRLWSLAYALESELTATCAKRDALRTELLEVAEAMNGPAVNNIRTLAESIRILQAERDALRAALKQAVARQGFTNDELISARALIANATGENK